MKRVLVGYDGSDAARRAVVQAAEVGARLAQPVTVLVVAEIASGAYSLAAPGMVDPIPPGFDTEAYESLVAEGVAAARDIGAEAEGRVEWGSPADRIAEVAESEGAGLIVLGHRGAGGLESLLLGSVAKRVIDRAHCSILIVR